MNKKTETIEQETQPDFDTEAAVADISSDLFGQGKEEEDDGEEDLVEGEQDKSSGEPSADVAEPAPQSTEEIKTVDGEVVEETSEEVQAVGAPKTWTKEALETWATIPPRAQEEILKREEDFFRGIGQYKAAAEVGQRYDAVVEPYKPILAAEGVDPVQLMQSFAANHYLLTKGTPQQKIELAATMLQGYEIPLADLLNHIADQDIDLNPPDPEVIALRKELGEIKSFIQSSQTSANNQLTARIDAEIEAFANDPAHPYFNELADDIHKLFKSGMANSLAEAYEKALYANPNTRQKEIDRLTAEKLSTVDAEAEKRKEKIAKSTAADVILTPKPRDGTVPSGSIDDTLEETMQKIVARG